MKPFTKFVSKFIEYLKRPRDLWSTLVTSHPIAALASFPKPSPALPPSLDDDGRPSAGVALHLMTRNYVKTVAVMFYGCFNGCLIAAPAVTAGSDKLARPSVY